MIRSMNLINGFGARGYSTRGIHLPIVFLRDCSLFIGSTGPVFRGMGQGLFLMLPSTGHKDFWCFYGMGHELFLEKSLKLYYLL